MTDIEAKLQPDIAEISDADPLASEWMRYFASIAMTGLATGRSSVTWLTEFTGH